MPSSIAQTSPLKRKRGRISSKKDGEIPRLRKEFNNWFKIPSTKDAERFAQMAASKQRRENGDEGMEMEED